MSTGLLNGFPGGSGIIGTPVDPSSPGGSLIDLASEVIGSLPAPGLPAVLATDPETGNNDLKIKAARFLKFLNDFQVWIWAEAGTGQLNVRSPGNVPQNLEAGDFRAADADRVVKLVWGAALGARLCRDIAITFVNNTTNPGTDPSAGFAWEGDKLIRVTDGAGGYGGLEFASGVRVEAGTGSPEGVVVANIGSFYMDVTGGPGTTLYYKGADNGLDTGWEVIGSPTFTYAGASPSAAEMAAALTVVNQAGFFKKGATDSVFWVHRRSTAAGGAAADFASVEMS